MKKGLRKLILSGTALAAVAATLGTSTYAWYTTNTKVEATNLSAESLASGDASIFISRTGEAGTWQQSVSLSDIAVTGIIPTMLNTTDGVLYPIEDNTQLSSTAATANTHYVQFDLYFKTSPTTNNVPVYIQTMSIKNALYSAGAATELDTKKTDNLLNGYTGQNPGISTSVTQYTKDIVNALAFTVQSVTTETSYKDGDGATQTFTALDGKAAYKPISTWVSAITETGSATNAHQYYNAVVGNKQADILADALTTDNSTVIDSNKMFLVLKNDGTAAKATFRFYLNGSDVDCFDACKGQTFGVNMSFTSKI